MRVTSAELVLDAIRQGGRVIVSTYNEPLITSEWAVAVFKEARAAGLVTGFVSNGNGTPQVLEYLRPWVDLYKVDLKSFDDRHYRQLGGRLQPILDTIRLLHEMGFWLEIVTLVIPGFNDSDDELTRLAEFLAGVSPDIPWHVTAFHKDYKMTDPENTSAGDFDTRGGDWQESRTPLRLCGEPAGRGGRSGEHALPQLQDSVDRALWLSDSRLPPDPERVLPIMRQQHPREMGARVSGPDHFAPLCAAHAPPIRFACAGLLRGHCDFLALVARTRMAPREGTKNSAAGRRPSEMRAF